MPLSAGAASAIAVSALAVAAIAACSTQTGIAAPPDGGDDDVDAAPLGAIVDADEPDASADAGEGDASGGGPFAALERALSSVEVASTGGALGIVLTDVASCGDVADGPTAGARFLDLRLFVVDGASTQTVAPTAPGDFAVAPTKGPGGYAVATLIAFDDACKTDGDAGTTITSGTVTLASIDDSAATGSYDLATSTGTYKGTFSSAVCRGVAAIDHPTAGGCHK